MYVCVSVSSEHDETFISGPRFLASFQKDRQFLIGATLGKKREVPLWLGFESLCNRIKFLEKLRLV